MTALEPMRALTLKPWWAHAVAFLDKDIENRAKPPPEALIGKRIAIHAGAPTWKGEAWLDEIDRAMGRERRRSYVSRHRGERGNFSGSIVPLAIMDYLERAILVDRRCASRKMPVFDRKVAMGHRERLLECPLDAKGHAWAVNA